MLAEVAGAVAGGGTHRDTHALEMLAPNGTTIAALAISNDDDGFAEAIAWIAGNVPGPRVVAGLEGTRSYGIGLARAVAAAGLIVVEVQAPRRADRRHRGKSDPIDAPGRAAGSPHAGPGNCRRPALRVTGRPCGPAQRPPRAEHGQGATVVQP